MAFNLNKSEEPASKGSKFDLSKNDGSKVTNIEKTGKSKIWLFALLGLLILGGVWYFFSNSKTNNNGATDIATISAVELKDSVTPSNAQGRASSTTDSTIKLDPGSASTSGQKQESATPEGSTPSTPEKNDVGSKNANKGNVENTTTNITPANLNKKVPASFGKASSSFNSIDKSLIKDIVTYLQSNPNASISVNGYASSEGELNINQQLSLKRADAFKRYLISKGIATNRIVAAGKGIDDPIASNDTEGGRNKNRRVEIALL